jgi:UDP-glucose 4-epimerase
MESDKKTAERRVLITGGTGMVGAHLAHRLLGVGYRLFLLSRSGASRLRLRSVEAHLEVLPGDLTDASAVRAAVARAQPHLVFHLASTPFNPPTTPSEAHLQVNVLGTCYLLEALRPFPEVRVIWTGSGAVYGSGTQMREEWSVRPATMLGVAKASASLLVQTFARLYSMQTVELRVFTPYGPWERPGRLIPSAILSALRGQEIRMTSGEQERDFLYIDDLIEALWLAATKPVPAGSVYNICSGQGRRIRDVVELILKLMGNPAPLQLGVLPTRADEIWRYSGDNTAAREGLAWRPRTSLEEGLQRTIDWFTENKELAGELI